LPGSGQGSRRCHADAGDHDARDPGDDQGEGSDEDRPRQQPRPRGLERGVIGPMTAAPTAYPGGEGDQQGTEDTAEQAEPVDGVGPEVQVDRARATAQHPALLPTVDRDRLQRRPILMSRPADILVDLQDQQTLVAPGRQPHRGRSGVLGDLRRHR